MELELTNGNYVPAADAGLVTRDGYMETVQRLMMRLAARRGGFCPLPEYGSRLHSLLGMKAGDRHGAACRFVHEALAEENARIERVECFDTAPGELEVRVWLDISGSIRELSIRI